MIGLASGATPGAVGCGVGGVAEGRGRTGVRTRGMGFGARAAALGATIRFSVPAVA